MPKRILQGTVTSDQNAQTVTVSVERRGRPVQGRRQGSHSGMRAEIEDETLGGDRQLGRSPTGLSETLGKRQ
jgi:ribosomal protein S17